MGEEVGGELWHQIFIPKFWDHHGTSKRTIEPPKYDVAELSTGTARMRRARRSWGEPRNGQNDFRVRGHLEHPGETSRILSRLVFLFWSGGGWLDMVNPM